MNVLSLFDGMSCGQQALERAGIKVENYFASEIDKYAIQITMANYPNTKQLGSVVDLNGFDLPKIDLLIGGSPCQSFSFAGKRKGMSTKDEQEILTLEHYLELKSQGFEFEGQSYLFWEFMRLLNETKPKYFLLENVKMSKKWKDTLSKAIGVEPILINSSLLSAQNRQRLYWTNIPNIEQPKDKGILIIDILEENPDSKFYLNDEQYEKVILKTKVNKNVTESKILDVYNNKIKEDGKSITLTDPCHNNLRLIQPIVHNMMPRSGNPKKGGTGHLTRNDGKTYCLDTGRTNAIEILNNKGEILFTKNYLQWDSSGKNNRSQGDRAYYSNVKSGTLTTRDNIKMVKESIIRRLTPIECERLQTVKDNYTEGVSDTQRYKMLGNGWTVDVIAHIFSYIV